MNRREFLECAAILIGGVSASQLGFSLSEAQRTYLATAPNYAARQADYLTPAQRRALAVLAEAIIPATDTPGAIDAGVPNFIELMVFEWFNEQERATFLAGLADIMASAEQKYRVAVDQLEDAQRLKLLEALEAQAGDAAWYEMGNVQRAFDSEAPFICQLKELTIWGFFTSETGATQVLRYEVMPMEFDGKRKLGKDESSWVATYP